MLFAFILPATIVPDACALYGCVFVYICLTSTLTPFVEYTLLHGTRHVGSEATMLTNTQWNIHDCWNRCCVTGVT